MGRRRPRAVPQLEDTTCWKIAADTVALTVKHADLFSALSVLLFPASAVALLAAAFPNTSEPAWRRGLATAGALTALAISLPFTVFGKVALGCVLGHLHSADDDGEMTWRGWTRIAKAAPWWHMGAAHACWGAGAVAARSAVTAAATVATDAAGARQLARVAAVGAGWVVFSVAFAHVYVVWRMMTCVMVMEWPRRSPVFVRSGFPFLRRCLVLLKDRTGMGLMVCFLGLVLTSLAKGLFLFRGLGVACSKPAVICLPEAVLVTMMHAATCVLDESVFFMFYMSAAKSEEQRRRRRVQNEEMVLFLRTHEEHAPLLTVTCHVVDEREEEEPCRFVIRVSSGNQSQV